MSALPVAVAVRGPLGTRRQRLLRAGAGLVAAAGLLDLVHALDALLAVPATSAESAGEATQSLVLLAVGLAGGWWAWRDRSNAAAGLALGSAALFLGFGVGEAEALRASQVLSLLPPAFTRAAVAVNLAVVVPVGLVVLLADRSALGEDEQLCPEAVDVGPRLRTTRN